MRILFVAKKRLSSYGTSVGLFNSATFVAKSLEQRLMAETMVVTVIDGNGIDKEVHGFKPDHVIIEALWVTPDKTKELVKKYPNIVWNIRIHSKTPFLSSEGIALSWMHDYKKIIKHHKNLRISGNSEEFVNDMSDVFGIKFDYLPNIYEPSIKKHRKHHEHKKHIDIGCFGAIRLLKNNLQQAVAAIIFADLIGKKLRFHINAERTEQRGEEVLKNIRALFKASEKHELVEHGWSPHEEFVNTIAKMDISMQISFSESFNIVTADAVYSEVPVVVSDDIDWVPSRFRSSTIDTNDMIEKLFVSWESGAWGTNLNKIFLKAHNHRSLEYWGKYIHNEQFCTSKDATGFF